MEFRTAPASRGLTWFQGGVRMLDRNPQGLITVAACLVLVEQAPKLFAMFSYPWWAALAVLSLLSPALSGGLLFAIDEAWHGRPVRLGYAFEGLRRPGARAQLVVLGLVGLIVLTLAVLAVWNIMGEDNIRIFGQLMANKIKPDSQEAMAMAPYGLKALMATLAIGFVWLAGVFFALPRVMFDGRSALGSLVESFMACVANVLSLTVYGLVFLAAIFVVTVGGMITLAFLSLLGPLGGLLAALVALAISVVGLLVNASGNYLAWREVFGHDLVAGAMQPPQAGIIV